MLEVCFSDALKGGLKFSLLKGKRTALLKDQHNILMPCFGLSFGNVKDVMDIELRKRLCRNQEELQFYHDVYRQCRQDLRYLKDNARQQSIRIWVDQTPDSVCGLLFVCHEFMHLQVNISMITLPQWIEDENGGVRYSCWGEVPFDQYERFLALEKPISKLYLKHLADCWERLMQEQAPLRALINGSMKSVPACYYDDRIKQYLSEKPIRVRELTGMVLGEEQLGITDDVILYRIIEMIQHEEICVVENAASIGWETWIRNDTKDKRKTG